LENFSKSDLTEVENILEDSVDAIYEVIKNGVVKAMAQFN